MLMISHNFYRLTENLKVSFFPSEKNFIKHAPKKMYFQREFTFCKYFNSPQRDSKSAKLQFICSGKRFICSRLFVETRCTDRLTVRESGECIWGWNIWTSAQVAE